MSDDEYADLERRLSRVEDALEANAATSTETRIAVAALGSKVDGLGDAIRDLAKDVRSDRVRPPPAPPSAPAVPIAAAASGGSVAAAVLAVVEFAKWVLGGASP